MKGDDESWERFRNLVNPLKPWALIHTQTYFRPDYIPKLEVIGKWLKANDEIEHCTPYTTQRWLLQHAIDNTLQMAEQGVMFSEPTVHNYKNEKKYNKQLREIMKELIKSRTM